MVLAYIFAIIFYSFLSIILIGLYTSPFWIPLIVVLTTGNPYFWWLILPLAIVEIIYFISKRIRVKRAIETNRKVEYYKNLTK